MLSGNFFNVFLFSLCFDLAFILFFILLKKLHVLLFTSVSKYILKEMFFVLSGFFGCNTEHPNSKE